MWCRRKSLDSTTPLLLFESSLVSLLVWARIVPTTHGRDVVCKRDVPVSIHRLRELLVRRSLCAQRRNVPVYTAATLSRRSGPMDNVRRRGKAVDFCRA